MPKRLSARANVAGRDAARREGRRGAASRCGVRAYLDSRRRLLTSGRPCRKSAAARQQYRGFRGYTHDLCGSLRERLWLALACDCCRWRLAAHAQTTKSETRFEDWVVACDDATGEKICSLSQTFTKSGTGEVVLACMLVKDAEGKLKRDRLHADAGPARPRPHDRRRRASIPSRPTAIARRRPASPTDFRRRMAGVFRKNTEYSVTFEPVNQKAAR